MGRGVYRSYYKGHKDKIKGEGRGGRGRWYWLGWGGGMGRKCRQLYLNKNKKKFKKTMTNMTTHTSLIKACHICGLAHQLSAAKLERQEIIVSKYNSCSTAFMEYGIKI